MRKDDKKGEKDREKKSKKDSEKKKNLRKRKNISDDDIPAGKRKKKDIKVIYEEEDEEEWEEDEEWEEEWEEDEDEEPLTIDINDILEDLLNRNENPVKKPESEEDIFLKSLSKEKKRKLIETEKRLLNYNKLEVPLKYKILDSNLPDNVKSQILQKITFFEQLPPFSSEYQKMKKYIDELGRIPFGIYSKLEVNSFSKPEETKKFIQKLRKDLHECTYGQNETKNSIIEVVAKWITNPTSPGNVLGLCGPPGTGKTSLIKNGLSKALNMPFSFIGLGGSTCSSFLQGHDYTYEGAKCGRISEILVESKCMNPIIFFDELDKISETKSGEEIVGLLTHLTDPTQNNSYSDKYFSGIDLDLSKCFIIFSFNDPNKINSILRDRIKIINLQGFKPEEKVKIAKNFSIKKICKNIGFEEDNIIFPEETLKSIINSFCPEQGVRTFEKCLETIIMKLNLYNISGESEDLKDDKEIELKIPYKITPDLADKFLNKVFTKINDFSYINTMYT